MPRKIDRAVKQDALLLHAQFPHLEQKDIARTMGISQSLFTKVKRNNKIHGDVECIPKKRGPKPKMDDGMLNVSAILTSFTNYFRFLLVWYCSRRPLLWRIMQRQWKHNSMCSCHLVESVKSSKNAVLVAKRYSFPTQCFMLKVAFKRS